MPFNIVKIKNTGKLSEITYVNPVVCVSAPSNRINLHENKIKICIMWTPKKQKTKQPRYNSC